MKRTKILSFWASRSIGDCDAEILVASLMMPIIDTCSMLAPASLHYANAVHQSRRIFRAEEEQGR